MDKKQVQTGDLEIKPLLVEQRSLIILQSWSNYQSSIGFHGAGIGTANFYQYFAFLVTSNAKLSQSILQITQPPNMDRPMLLIIVVHF